MLRTREVPSLFRGIPLDPTPDPGGLALALRALFSGAQPQVPPVPLGTE